MSWMTRPAVPADAGALARLNSDSFEGYRAFAPLGWEPPPAEQELDSVSDKLGLPEVWCTVAEARGELVGHVAFMPATLARRPLQEPGLAHFWMLFVRPSHWGTGLAAELHASALAAAADRGFSSMRLYTPADHGRARRFYEREGWTPFAEPFHDEDFGLPVVEYRRRLDRP